MSFASFAPAISLETDRVRCRSRDDDRRRLQAPRLPLCLLENGKGEWDGRLRVALRKEDRFRDCRYVLSVCIWFCAA